MQNNESLAAFVEEIYGDSHLRVEADLGGGFVRLRTSEAERRQAAQDIRSSEDIVIELLRNARDAGSRNIYLAFGREESTRTLIVIDDGDGIPASMHEKIFEPRVTSKLDTAHMDKWGMHGRGMALYSVSVNALEAYVAGSLEGVGTSIVVRTDVSKLSEKADQSTFPRFEVQDNGAHAMRGPKNILRTAAEFALEHHDICNVFCGSVGEIAGAMYKHGKAALTPQFRTFGSIDDCVSIPQRLACAGDHVELCNELGRFGIELSERTCRRIIAGGTQVIPSMAERIKAESFPEAKEISKSKRTPGRDARNLKITQSDQDLFAEKVSIAYQTLAEAYYLNPDIKPEVKVSGDAIRIVIPVEKLL